MARITGGYRRVGLPESACKGDTVLEVPVHWDTLAASVSLFAVCDARR